MTPSGDAAEPFSAELARIAASLELESPTTFSLFGRRHRTPGEGNAAPADSMLIDRAREQLADVLYGAVHCRQPPDLTRVVTAPTLARDFVHRLSGANCGSGTWEPGWVACALEPDGRLVVQRGDLRIWAAATQFQAAGVPEPGAEGRLRVGKEQLGRFDGFYLAVGNALQRGSTDGMVRVYWHITARGAERLTAVVTRAFNRAQLPFYFKILRDPLTYHRADAAVLYLPRGACQGANAPMSEAYRDVRGWLRPPTSGFAKRLGPGIGLAEDPIGPASFGQHRSRLLAAALSAPEVAAASPGDHRLAAVVARLENAGVDLAAPYLNPGSSNGYQILDRGERIGV